MVAKKNPQTISEIAPGVRSFGAYALTNEFEYQDEGIPFLRGTNYAGDFVNFAGVLRISPEAHQLLHKSEVLPGMVLLSMSGSVGSVAVALDSWNYPINSNQDIAKIIPSSVNPFYLAAFLSSSFGRTQINRLPVGSVQQHIFLWMIERIQVPRFSFSFEAAVARITQTAYESHEMVSQYFAEAEDTLLDALGLADWTPPEPLSYSARASDAFAAGRLDAEFFQPRLKSLINKLEEAAGNFRLVRLGDYSEPLKYGSSEKLEYTDKGTPFLRIADLNERRFDLLSVKFIDNKLTFSESETAKLGDILVSRSGTLGLAAPITEEFDDAIFGSYFIRVRPDSSVLNTEFLTLFINSIAGAVQFEAVKTGGIQTNLTISAIENLMIPLGTLEWQTTFATLISRGLGARARAHQTRKAAQRAVEIAIENGEAAALGFLDQSEGAI